MNTKFTHKKEGDGEERLLERFGRSNPFTVPEGYFEGLHEEVMAKVASVQPERRPVGRVRTVFMGKRPVYMAGAAAAAVAVLFAVSFFMSYFKTSAGLQLDEQAQAEGMVYDIELESLLEGTYLDDYSLYQLVSDAN